MELEFREVPAIVGTSVDDGVVGRRRGAKAAAIVRTAVDYRVGGRRGGAKAATIVRAAINDFRYVARCGAKGSGAKRDVEIVKAKLVRVHIILFHFDVRPGLDQGITRD